MASTIRITILYSFIFKHFRYPLYQPAAAAAAAEVNRMTHQSFCALLQTSSAPPPGARRSIEKPLCISARRQMVITASISLAFPSDTVQLLSRASKAQTLHLQTAALRQWAESELTMKMMILMMMMTSLSGCRAVRLLECRWRPLCSRYINDGSTWLGKKKRILFVNKCK